MSFKYVGWYPSAGSGRTARFDYVLFRMADVSRAVAAVTAAAADLSDIDCRVGATTVAILTTRTRLEKVTGWRPPPWATGQRWSPVERADTELAIDDALAAAALGDRRHELATRDASANASSWMFLWFQRRNFNRLNILAVCSTRAASSHSTETWPTEWLINPTTANPSTWTGYTGDTVGRAGWSTKPPRRSKRSHETDLGV